jgi:hypothetical protein
MHGHAGECKDVNKTRRHNAAVHTMTEVAAAVGIAIDERLTNFKHSDQPDAEFGDPLTDTRVIIDWTVVSPFAATHAKYARQFGGGAAQHAQDKKAHENRRWETTYPNTIFVGPAMETTGHFGRSAQNLFTRIAEASPVLHASQRQKFPQLIAARIQHRVKQAQAIQAWNWSDTQQLNLASILALRDKQATAELKSTETATRGEREDEGERVEGGAEEEGDEDDLMTCYSGSGGDEPEECDDEVPNANCVTLCEA